MRFAVMSSGDGSGSRSVALSILVCLVLSCSSSLAQTGTALVRGRVHDPQGAAVLGVTVRLINTSKRFTRETSTNEQGDYLFTAIPPDSYTIEAEVAGFKKTVVTQLQASVDTPTQFDFALEVGDIAITVDVVAEAPINTLDATIGNSFNSRQIQQLPLDSRNVVNLLSLQPGVTQDGYVSGSRADQANITLDGVDVNEQQQGMNPATHEAFYSVLRVSPDSMGEFRVTVANPNANQGRSSGAQVSLVTRSGSNEWHGSLYEFHRNKATTANDFFNNRSALPRPNLIRNLFGVSLGGPVIKDKVFFFYNYEGRRDASQGAVVRSVPLASLGRGEIRYQNLTGGVTTRTSSEIDGFFPEVRVNPAALSFLAGAAARYPANDDTVGDGLNTGGFRFNTPTPLNWNAHTAKLDFNLNPDHTLFLRGNAQQDEIGGSSRFPDTPSLNFWSHPIGFAAGHDWTIGSSKINSLRYGMTRLALSDQGDSDGNDILFRLVYQPRHFARTLSRVMPVHNISDDFSWTRGRHTLQTGINIRLYTNRRGSFSRSFDFASTNPFFLQDPAALTRPFEDFDGDEVATGAAVAAVLGRYSQYQANFNFGADRRLMPVGSRVERHFASQEYDFYFQDFWKLRPTLTLTLGLRYSLARPVYESNGLQVKPTTSLGDFLDRRISGAAQGQPVNDLISFDLAGPANGRPGAYEWDKNNFQPRIAVAWSPSFDHGVLGTLIGQGGTTVFRGGFAVLSDHFGQQLSASFDQNGALGFASSQVGPIFDLSDNPGPAFTGVDQDFRDFPGIEPPPDLILTQPADGLTRIESSLDDTLKTPMHYSWNASWARNFGGGFVLEASYIGRAARNLLAQRDVMALNNLVDPQSGTDWYTAARQLANLRDQNVPIDSVQPIAYFENLFPNLGANLLDNPNLTPTHTAYLLAARQGVDGFDLDWTLIQDIINDLSALGPDVYFHPQYAALSTSSSIGSSDYHAGAFTLRRRFSAGFGFDFNYTLAKSLDNASGLENSGDFALGAFIVNSLRPQDNRAFSDFDIRHLVNSNFLWNLPFGRNRPYLPDLDGWAQALLGGWSFNGIVRWNSGLPAPTPFDAGRWATNWQIQSNGVRHRPIQTSPTRGGAGPPNLFSDPTRAYQSFRNALAGETGDRNVLRRPGFVGMDTMLGKTWRMPWSETHRLQFRWEVFNVTNTQRLFGLSDLSLETDPHLGSPSASFGNFISIQGTPRVMQFGLRYDF